MIYRTTDNCTHHSRCANNNTHQHRQYGRTNNNKFTTPTFKLSFTSNLSSQKVPPSRCQCTIVFPCDRRTVIELEAVVDCATKRHTPTQAPTHMPISAAALHCSTLLLHLPELIVKFYDSVPSNPYTAQMPPCPYSVLTSLHIFTLSSS